MQTEQMAQVSVWMATRVDDKCVELLTSLDVGFPDNEATFRFKKWVDTEHWKKTKDRRALEVLDMIQDYAKGMFARDSFMLKVGSVSVCPRVEGREVHVDASSLYEEDGSGEDRGSSLCGECKKAFVCTSGVELVMDEKHFCSSDCAIAYYDRCPFDFCQLPVKRRCRCRARDTTCEAGHSWHVCSIHKRRVVGRLNHSEGIGGCLCTKPVRIRTNMSWKRPSVNMKRTNPRNT
jgi:hypothetical protein